MGKRNRQAGTVLLLAPEEILPNPYQPRRLFETKELESLADSIRENGILQPLTVRKCEQGGGYELITGERRLRAARLAGLPQVPCLLAQVSDERSALLALVENIQRQDLGFFEEAQAIQRMMDAYGLTQEQMAKTLGKAASTLSNKLRLLKLPPAMRGQITAAGLTERHARALLRIEAPAMRQKLLEAVMARELNVQETERLIDMQLHTGVLAEAAAEQRASKKRTIRLVRDVRLFVNTIHHAVDAMRSSGIPALSETTESEEYLIYTVRIPKEPASRAAN